MSSKRKSATVKEAKSVVSSEKTTSLAGLSSNTNVNLKSKVETSGNKKRKTSTDDKPKKTVSKSLSKKKIIDLLANLGVKVDEDTGGCALAAISKGYIKFIGEASDLKQVIWEGEDCSGECEHVLKATLEDLLKQTDYPGSDYEDGMESATILCKEDGCDGRVYLTRFCLNQPTGDSGKFHNHCRKCTKRYGVFGVCVGDYRNIHCDSCGKHFWGSSGCNNPRCKGPDGNRNDCSLM